MINEPLGHLLEHNKTLLNDLYRLGVADNFLFVDNSLIENSMVEVA